MDALVGGGIWGLLAVMTVQLIRRTREIDARRDTLTQAYVAHDRMISADRDALLTELRELRAQMAVLQIQLVEGRSE